MKRFIAKVKFSSILFTLLISGTYTLKAQKAIMSGSPSSIISSTALIPEGTPLFFTSGFTASAVNPDLKDGDYEKYGNTETQALNILEKIKAILTENGVSMGSIFSMKVYISPDTKTGEYDFAGWNKAYVRYFGNEDNPNKPVRATVGVATLVNPHKFIEIEVIATRN